MVPDHIEWFIDDIKNAGYSDKLFHKFKFNYTGLYSTYDPSLTYKQAIRNRLSVLANENTLAICISGKDGEIIVNEAYDMGLKFELFFLDLWSVNSNVRGLAYQLASKFNKILNVVSVSRDNAISWAEYWFLKSRINIPTYLLMPLLLEKIPKDYYIVIGEGDLNKGSKYHQKKYILNSEKKGVLILNSEISYWIWSIEYNRPGDFYFHSASPELITSVWNDPLLVYQYPVIDNTKIISKYWGDFIFKNKTTNWESDQGIKDYFLIKNHLAKKYKINHDFYFDVVDITSTCEKNSAE